MSKIDHLLVPTSVAMVAADVGHSTLHMWAKRGKITKHGTRYRAMWDLYEIQKLVAARPIDTRTTRV